MVTFDSGQLAIEVPNAIYDRIDTNAFYRAIARPTQAVNGASAPAITSALSPRGSEHRQVLAKGGARRNEVAMLEIELGCDAADLVILDRRDGLIGGGHGEQALEKPELLVITSSACNLYSKEAIQILGVEDRVGLLKLGTTWPIPPKLVGRHLGSTEKVLIVEEVVCFLEDQVKILTAELGPQIGTKTFYGKRDGSVPMVGEMNPDHVVGALAKILGIQAETVPEEYTRRTSFS